MRTHWLGLALLMFFAGNASSGAAQPPTVGFGFVLFNPTPKNLEAAAVVVQHVVVAGSPAMAAGLRRLDSISHINETAFADPAAATIRLRQLAKEENCVRLRVVRDSRVIHVGCLSAGPVVFAEAPDEADRSSPTLSFFGSCGRHVVYYWHEGRTLAEVATEAGLQKPVGTLCLQRLVSGEPSKRVCMEFPASGWPAPPRDGSYWIMYPQGSCQ